MTESRIPKVLANRVWLTFAHHPGASGLHCMRAALDAHLDELAALVQPDQGGVWVVIAEEETYGERKRVQVWVPDAKAVPAPELPAADHVCDSGNFDRTVCGCGAMHSYCGTCGKRADECNLPATTTTVTTTVTPPEETP